MQYISTRDVYKKKVAASEAIVNGPAPDGGLYVPCDFPEFTGFAGKPYEDISFDLLKLFLTDFSDRQLREYVNLAYGDNLPVKLNGDYLELFHGRTLAFKDVALQIFPYLLTAALRKNNVLKTAVVLTATSGDTGSAVLAGMANVPGTRAIVFYPDGGVSEIQKLQMTTQEGDNVSVFAIKGNFDDAQRAVKEVLADRQFQSEYADKYLFTSANSINIGRLLPQVAYYFYCYSELVKDGRLREGDAVNFAVPTGNFGNILAGYYARKMGLPINKLICAANSNKVLDDFFKTGVYDSNRKFYTTISPSMDILVSSNLERLTFENASLDMFDSDYATDEETLQTIRDVYASRRYILDPHTAVGQCVCNKYIKRTGDKTISIVLATASPYKFPESIESALGNGILGDPPQGIGVLKEKPVLHGSVTDDIRKAIGGVLA